MTDSLKDALRPTRGVERALVGARVLLSSAAAIAMLLGGGVPVSAQGTSGAVLGASAEAWTQALGQPNDHSVEVQLDFQRCPDGQTDQLIASVLNDHIWQILRQPCANGDETPSAAMAEASHYLPSDASAAGTFAASDGTMSWQYTSASYAAMLTPAQFVDCDGNPVAAGTFYINASDGGWLIGPGTCPS
jgi:hypothetical protein